MTGLILIIVGLVISNIAFGILFLHENNKRGSLERQLSIWKDEYNHIECRVKRYDRKIDELKEIIEDKEEKIIHWSDLADKRAEKIRKLERKIYKLTRESQDLVVTFNDNNTKQFLNIVEDRVQYNHPDDVAVHIFKDDNDKEYTVKEDYIKAIEPV